MEFQLLRTSANVEVTDMKLEAYAEVQNIVDEVAAALKLDLVVRADSFPKGASRGIQSDYWVRRAVMHHRAALNITPLVIARLPK